MKHVGLDDEDVARQNRPIDIMVTAAFVRARSLALACAHASKDSPAGLKTNLCTPAFTGYRSNLLRAIVQ